MLLTLTSLHSLESVKAGNISSYFCTASWREEEEEREGEGGEGRREREEEEGRKDGGRRGRRQREEGEGGWRTTEDGGG